MLRSLRRRRAADASRRTALRWSRAAAALPWLLLAACGRFEAAAAGEPFRLTLIRPAIAEGLFLNEDLVFYFSEEIDPVSVSGGSVQIVSTDGRPARGALVVEVDKIRFVPAPVLASDLSDGGYVPGTSYAATLVGFPRPDGLRSARGSLLERTVTWSFRTVQVSSPPTALVFEDNTPERAGFLRLFPAAAGQGSLIGSQDAIYLACDKPLDPSSIREEGFELTAADTHRTVGVRARLVENHDESSARPRPAATRSSAPPEAWERERRACLIELIPRERLRPGTWELRLASGGGDRVNLPLDFGGRPVLFDAPSSALQIEVRTPAADAGRGTLREEFDTDRFRSPVAVPGYDGTAYWKNSGRVEVHYPAAAGSGADGALVLGSALERTEVQATSIDLEQGTTCVLHVSPGLVVLRSQGRITLRGSLVRAAPWDAEVEVARDPTLLQWADRARRTPNEPTLSEWLVAARAGSWNWTVLVAGGDLTIDGALSVSTPLLLVAGGMIRVTGSVRGIERAVVVPAGPAGEPAREALKVGGVFRLGEGGGYGIEPATSDSPPPLNLDTPHGTNPVVRRLRYAVLSAPIPPRGEVLRWLPPEVRGRALTEIRTLRPAAQDLGAGWRVRYLRELHNPTPKGEDLTLFDSPMTPDPPGPLQILLELEIEPGGNWDPPWIDSVHLSWDQPPANSTSGGGGR